MKTNIEFECSSISLGEILYRAKQLNLTEQEINNIEIEASFGCERAGYENDPYPQVSILFPKQLLSTDISTEIITLLNEWDKE